MLLALSLLPLVSAAELELGVGGQSLGPGGPDAALRGVTRLVLGHAALDLSATWTPGPPDVSDLTHLMLWTGSPVWTEHRDRLHVNLLGDWILGEAESEHLHGSPHLYGGVTAWQATRITSSHIEQRRSQEWGLSPTFGGGVSAGAGRVTLRFMLTASPRRSPMGEGLDATVRGSCDLIVRPWARPDESG